MISTHRIKKARELARTSAIATLPHARYGKTLTENPYHMYSAQGRAFSKEYSDMRKTFGKMLMRCE